MKAVLFSGGWDSIAATLRILRKGITPDLLFVNYGQIYFDQELKVCNEFAEEFELNLRVIQLPLEHDMERRNFYLINEAKRLGYEMLYTGNRNIAPIFDKYKDSNFLSIKAFAYLMNIKIKMPVLLWPKRLIVKYCQKYFSGIPYNCYKAKDNYLECDCPNCKELQRIL